MSVQPYTDLATPDHLAHNPAHDSEAETINELIQQHNQPPEAADKPKDRTTQIKPPKPADRLLSGTITMNLGDNPVMLQPASPLRKWLRLTCRSATATDFIRVADDNGKLQMLSAAGTVVVGIESVEFPEYTGPLWVSFQDGVGPVTVTFIAIARGAKK